MDGHWMRRWALAAAAGLLAATPAMAAPAAGSGEGSSGVGVSTAHAAHPVAHPTVRKPDLGDQVSGRWLGDVISDFRGSSRKHVTLTVTRIGPNLIQVESDYRRLPVVAVNVEVAGRAIVQRTGDTVFVYNLDSGQLDVSFHNEVSWSGKRP